MASANKRSRKKKPTNRRSAEISSADKNLWFKLANKFNDTTKAHNLIFGTTGFKGGDDNYSNWRNDGGDLLMHELKTTVAGNVAQKIILELAEGFESLETIKHIIASNDDRGDDFGWLVLHNF